MPDFGTNRWIYLISVNVKQRVMNSKTKPLIIILMVPRWKPLRIHNNNIGRWRPTESKFIQIWLKGNIINDFGYKLSQV